MAIGWLSVLKSVPWSDVISNAPLVADGARKLWNSVGKKPAEPAVTNAESAPGTVAGLEARVAALETAVSDLHSQMLASSELIKALSDQNTGLIKRAEAARVRMRWLSAASVIALVLAAGSLTLLLTR
jgi:amino acid transporter